MRYLWTSIAKWFHICEMIAIWYHLCNLKNVKKTTHGGVLLLVKLQGEVCNFTKSNTPPWVLFKFFKLYKWYQIARSVTFKSEIENILISQGTWPCLTYKRLLLLLLSLLLLLLLLLLSSFLLLLSVLYLMWTFPNFTSQLMLTIQ